MKFEIEVSKSPMEIILVKGKFTPQRIKGVKFSRIEKNSDWI